MPASSINFYHMQDSKNNLNAVRPVPICADSDYYTTPCQNIYISNNCYYGYHDPKSIKHVQEYEDCEMKEITNTSHNAQIIDESTSQHCNNRKRSADDFTYHQNKRQRKEVQTKKSYEPETNEKKRLETRTEELMESLYWNIHGGTLYSCYNNNCD